MRHFILVFLFFSLYSEMVYSKACPKVDFSKCPDKSICKQPALLKGKKLESLLKDLKETEYDLPWTVASENELTLTTKFFESLRKVDKIFKKSIGSFKKQIQKYKETKKISKKITKASFELSEKIAKLSFWAKKDSKKILKEIKGVKKVKVSLDYKKIDGKTGKTNFYLYQLRKKALKPRPVLLIMPPIYGISPFDIGMAIEYASLGFQVAILELDGVKFVSPFRAINSLKPAMKRVIGDTHRMIEYLKKHSNIDSENMGIFGFSLGGLLSSMVYVLNHEIKVLGTAMGGANFPELFTNSQQAMGKLYRIYRMKKENIKTKKGYFSVLESALPYEPMALAYRRKQNHVYFVASMGDSLVPSKNQWELTKAFGASCEKGNVRWEKDQHFIAIVKDLLKRNKLRKFFMDKLMK